MSQLLSLGAIKKNTGEYVYPKIANKHDQHICPECNKDLILCQGEIRAHYFRHKVDSINPCHHYSNPTETQIHKDAKILLKNLLERKIPISFVRNCCFCNKLDEFEIPEITETSTIQVEYRFEYTGLKIADVAYIDNDEIVCIFEICNTHKTCATNRPDPWFEIDAATLIKIANDIDITSLQIPCIRQARCDDCIEQDKIKRINTLKQSIDKCKKSFVEVDMDWMYEDNKSKENRLIALNTELVFVENDISYVERQWNIYEIKHPVSNQIIRITSKGKTFVNGRWGSIPFYDIVKWYNNDTNNAIDDDNKSIVCINDNTTLKHSLTAKNKTERQKILSNYLQSHNIGEISKEEKYYFTTLYHRHYSYKDGRTKFNMDEIQSVFIDRGEYNTKCFILIVNDAKYSISIKCFTN